MTEVVISGIGMHGAFGDFGDTLDALAQGRTAVTRVSVDGAPGFPDVLGAPAGPYDPGCYAPDRKLVKYMSRTAQLAVLASGRAIERAGLMDDPQSRAAMALFVATGYIAFDLSNVARSAEASKTADGAFDLGRMGEEGLRLCHPLMPFKMLLNMPLGLVSIAFGIRGENFVLYPGADQAGIAFETAWRGIRNGRFVRALVGGCGQGLSPIPLATLIRQDRVACPDDTGGGRFPIADLAAFVILESAQAAEDRGARAIARIDSVRLARPQRSSQSLAAFFGGDPDGHRPDSVVVTGCIDSVDLQVLTDAAASAWPGTPPALASFDDRLGHCAAASLPLALGLAVESMSRGSVPVQQDLSAPRDLLILSAAADEALFSCRVRSVEAPQ
ncbi:MAG: beta-ketoacyl synthase N-terminal-like domain-containing protein [Acidobacteriota bacterium]